MKSWEIINRILDSNNFIFQAKVFKYSTATKIQDRVHLTPEQLHWFQLGIERKAQTNSRFWDSLLTEFIKHKNFDELLLKESLYHQSNSNTFEFDKKEFINFINEANGENVAFNSRVVLHNGDSKHIPLLDFKIRSDIDNHKIVISAIEALGLKGYLFDSGASYHFIGNELVEEVELIKILAKFVLLDPISDKAWAAHQIIERSASLRITAKGGNFPTLITEVI